LQIKVAEISPKKKSIVRDLARLAVVAPVAVTMSGGLMPLSVEAAEVLNVRAARHVDYTRLVFDLASPVRYGFRYGNPYELIIALEGGAPGGPDFSGEAGLIESVRRMDPGGRRYVVKLKDAGKISRIFYLEPDQDASYRLVIDLVDVPRSEWAVLVAATTPPEQESEPEPESEPAPTIEDELKLEVAEPVPAPAAEDSTPAEAYPVALNPEDSLFDGMSVGGYVQVEGRAFTQSSREQGPDDVTGSVALAPRLDYTWNGGRQLISFAPFARVDAVDKKRTHVDIRELKWVGAFDRFEVRLGIDNVFWGVTESVHLVDILNQDDMLEDIDAEDKLGQPMAVASWDSPAGLFSVYAMTYHRERKFAGRKGRPRGPLLIDNDQVQYQSGDEEWHFDWAARWSHAMGPVDIALSHFSGTARDPVFVAGVGEGGEPVLIPRYNLIDQTSLEFQATFDALLLKFEGFHRSQPGRDFFAGAGGFEYTVFNAFGQSDLGFLAEYLWDERGRAADNPFEDDLFTGVRWSANDIAGTTILAGSIFDLDSKAKFVNLEASRRFGNHWTLSLDARLLLSVPATDPFYYFADDDFIQLRLERHF